MINTAASLLLQLISIICGFIVPRLIIVTYGSDVNGLTSSITQFLSYIVLVEAGVGGVVRAALYKPIASADNRQISGVINATESFFRKIAYIFAGYMVVLAALYPFLVNREFNFLYTSSLVIIIGLSTFAQYYFGMTYTIFVQADQRRYISSILQMITVVLNTVFVIVFIYLGANIHILKLGTAFVYILRPVFLNIYVRRKYKFDRSVPPDRKALSQKWDGLGHHIAYFVNLNTDVVVLTLFSKISAAVSISEVSVYTVYYAVVSGIEKLTESLSSGVEAAFGNIIANGEHENLNKKFALYEFVSHTLTTFMFTCTGILIVPFIKVYTKNISDADYIRPLFAYILVLAQATYCLRIPYHIVTLAAGHYKQTRNGAFAEAGINVVLSAVLVYFFGIVGVAVGTLAAMIFRTVQYAYYLSKNILCRSLFVFIKRILISALCAVASVAIMRFIPHMAVDSYNTWLLFALETAVVTMAVTCLINLILSRKEFIGSVNAVRSTLTHKK